MRNKDKPIQFYVEDDVKKEFEIICKKLYVNKSEFFRSKMKEFIEENKSLIEGEINNE